MTYDLHEIKVNDMLPKTQYTIFQTWTHHLLKKWLRRKLFDLAGNLDPDKWGVIFISNFKKNYKIKSFTQDELFLRNYIYLNNT